MSTPTKKSTWSYFGESVFLLWWLFFAWLFCWVLKLELSWGVLGVIALGGLSWDYVKYRWDHRKPHA